MVDVRALANLVLDVASELGVPVTNLAINKIVYFLHEDFLLNFEKALTSAKIEAWEHGPVFRELYTQFKAFGDKRITAYARKLDFQTGRSVVCKLSEDELSLEEQQFVRDLATKLVPLSASKLRQISHMDGGPWYEVWNHIGRTNAGMQITDDIIVRCGKGPRKQ